MESATHNEWQYRSIRLKFMSPVAQKIQFLIQEQLRNFKLAT